MKCAQESDTKTDAPAQDCQRPCEKLDETTHPLRRPKHGAEQSAEHATSTPPLGHNACPLGNGQASRTFFFLKKKTRKVDVAEARREAKKLNQHLQECSKTNSMCAATTMPVTSWLKHDTAGDLADNKEKPLIRPDGQQVDRKKTNRRSTEYPTSTSSCSPTVQQTSMTRHWKTRLTTHVAQTRHEVRNHGRNRCLL